MQNLITQKNLIEAIYTVTVRNFKPVTWGQ